jgi:hypothetical protein
MWSILLGQPFPADVDGWDVLAVTSPNWHKGMLGNPSRHDYWRSVEGEVLPQWISANPGTRPAAWWMFDAPRWEHPNLAPRLRRDSSAPRRILVDGVPTEPEAPGMIVTTLFKGTYAPAPWSKRWDGEQLVELEVETEASYLRRHGLLTAAEVRSLAKHPAPEFAPLMVSLWAYGFDEPETEGEA